MESTKQQTRPRGVWFLTIYLGIFAGILPIILGLFLILNQEANQALASATGQTNINIALGILLNILVVITAIGAWRGNNRIKIAFLVMVTLHYALLALNNIQIANMDPSLLPDDFDTSRNMARVIRSVIYIIGIWWYFNRNHVRLFYKPESADLI